MHINCPLQEKNNGSVPSCPFFPPPHPGEEHYPRGKHSPTTEPSKMGSINMAQSVDTSVPQHGRVVRKACLAPPGVYGQGASFHRESAFESTRHGIKDVGGKRGWIQELPGVKKKSARSIAKMTPFVRYVPSVLATLSGNFSPPNVPAVLNS